MPLHRDQLPNKVILGTCLGTCLGSLVSALHFESLILFLCSQVTLRIDYCDFDLAHGAAPQKSGFSAVAWFAYLVVRYICGVSAAALN